MAAVATNSCYPDRDWRCFRVMPPCLTVGYLTSHDTSALISQQQTNGLPSIKPQILGFYFFDKARLTEPQSSLATSLSKLVFNNFIRWAAWLLCFFQLQGNYQGLLQSVNSSYTSSDADCSGWATLLDNGTSAVIGKVRSDFISHQNPPA